MQAKVNTKNFIRYDEGAEELKKIVAEKYAAKAEWTKANPELAAKFFVWR